MKSSTRGSSDISFLREHCSVFDEVVLERFRFCCIISLENVVVDAVDLNYVIGVSTILSTVFISVKVVHVLLITSVA